MPIVDLMAISSSHFSKLKDFIQMQLPAGFPVKIGKKLFCTVAKTRIVLDGKIL
jgi:septin 4